MEKELINQAEMEENFPECEKEFKSLSDFEEKIINPNGKKGLYWFYPAGEVKEFIKICEKECCSVCEKVIRKHAGDKLITKS